MTITSKRPETGSDGAQVIVREAGAGKKPLGLYIHIPFCERKCRYCAFLSFPDVPEEGRHTYAEGVCREIRSWHKGLGEGYLVDTVFVGGGTPSLLDAADMAKILDTVRDTFGLEQGAEISAEGNPNSLTDDLLAAWRDAGINRVSIGAQSLDDDVLAILGRVHRSDDVLRAFQRARLAGFSNINIDLMSAIPGQAPGSWEESLRTVLEWQPEHISFYTMQLEEGTPFYNDYKNEILEPVTPQAERWMYHHGIFMLRNAGYEHYEISNCCLPDRECLHNLKYWNMEEYLGVGLGASSFLRAGFSDLAADDAGGGSDTDGGGEKEDHGVRFRNLTDSKRYLNAVYKGDLPVNGRSVHRDSRADSIGICVFTALRRKRGLDRRAFLSRYGVDILEAFPQLADQIREWKDLGLIRIDASSFSLTEKGIDVSNSIMAEFV